MKRMLKLKSGKKQRVKYRVGDKVRVQFKRGSFTRGYDEQAGSQRFIINRIDTKSRNYPLYYLVDERGKEIEGGAFLQSQLVRINLKEEYRGRVLKKITRKNKKYAKMRWKGYSSDWDSEILLP